PNPSASRPPPPSGPPVGQLTTGASRPPPPSGPVFAELHAGGSRSPPPAGASRSARPAGSSFDELTTGASRSARPEPVEGRAPIPAPLILNLRYSPRRIRPSSHTTIDATVSLP